MGESVEKQRCNAVTHVVFDLDGLLLGYCIVLYAVLYAL